MKQIERSTVIQEVRRVLKEMTKTQRHIRHTEFWQRTVRKLVSPELQFPSLQLEQKAARLCDMNDPNHALSLEFSKLLQQLLMKGYIIPRLGNQGPEMSNLVVTDRGIAWTSLPDPVPEDAESYMSALQRDIASLDDIIKQYAQEALVTYSQQAFFASSVMLGAANERMTYLIMETLLKSTTDAQYKKRIEKCLTVDRKLTQMFILIDIGITNGKSAGMPYAVHEGAERHLLSIQEAIRVQRNDAVHPQAGKVTPVTLRLSLAAFPAACKKMYDLIGWFQQNSS
jgi:hypothetical protein